ncbi:cation:proton antiporter [Terribacillus saccharophilus]|uniref:Sodium:proton antiporter n=1 Tax=Terribacillus saccharophilus TaxID=361277 RepID=A0A268A7F1_9BACI|nr:cation:proton antiporter [Terribacillus saccharophilus]PAD20057.1 sodium:proton antiporter [Terribacillus saccharophilus]PAF17302.1 sodium:proton antiporter [Terribacillus saccharophilus]PAF35499.1 sodium:proton antiporter [Terribacillus saccharophilus]PAF40333.1 sodium:proton antiporter [Terribacillus saccharophilus]
MEFILHLALILLFTKIAGQLALKIGQPSVLGELLAGVILGPAVLGWIQQTSFIHEFSEIGVLVLMFIAGLETDLQQLKENWKSAFAVAVLGVIFPFIGGYSLALAFGMSQGHALFLALLFCATSVSISVQALKEMNKLNSREGTTILGAAVVDDILVVVLLAVLMSVLGTGESVSLGALIGKKVLFFGVIIVACIWLIPLAMKLFARFKVSETIVSAGIILALVFSYFAEYMGVAGIIGAFAAGIAISQTEYKDVVEHKLEPIAYGVFVPVFFVSIGLNISLDGVGSQILFIVLISIMAIVTKLLGGALGARLTGFNGRSSMAIGTGMVSRGEVALIIAGTGLSSGLLDPEYYTSIIIMVIVTTLVTPSMLKFIFSKTGDTSQQRSVS